MTISIRIDPTGERAVTERPGLLAWLLLGRDERVYEAVRDRRGVWWAIRDDRADLLLPWKVQREIDDAIRHRERRAAC